MCHPGQRHCPSYGRYLEPRLCNPELEVVLSATNLSTHGSQEQKDETNYEDDYANCPENCNFGDEADHQQDNADDDHDFSLWLMFRFFPSKAGDKPVLHSESTGVRGPSLTSTLRACRL